MRSEAAELGLAVLADELFSSDIHKIQEFVPEKSYVHMLGRPSKDDELLIIIEHRIRNKSITTSTNVDDDLPSKTRAKKSKHISVSTQNHRNK